MATNSKCRQVSVALWNCVTFRWRITHQQQKRETHGTLWFNLIKRQFMISRCSFSRCNTKFIYKYPSIKIFNAHFYSHFTVIVGQGHKCSALGQLLLASFGLFFFLVNLITHKAIRAPQKLPCR